MTPKIIEFDTYGSGGDVDITVLQSNQHVDFTINRVFWLTNPLKGQERGNHAHKSAYHIIWAIEGKIEIVINSQKGESQTFVLDSPNKGLFLPPNYWRVLRYLDVKTIQVVASSAVYDPKDYLTDFDKFTRYQYQL
ncbi:MAG: FdtA/QdtA family cupin domain-containing protein [Flavobacteriales bacterium]|nr:FdtA/QdtA family cupin domain-containing protein [Flavobacteriales bacterium]